MVIVITLTLCTFTELLLSRTNMISFVYFVSADKIIYVSEINSYNKDPGVVEFITYGLHPIIM